MTSLSKSNCFIKYAGIIILCLIIQSCKNTISNNGTIDWTHGKKMSEADRTNCPDSLQQKYLETSAILALRDVHNNESTKSTLIEIPPELTNLYFNSILHIFNITAIPARDSVISIYQILAFPHPQTHSLIVSVDSTKNWVKNWQSGQQLTGNSEIDKLMEKYDLQLDKYYNWPSNHAAIVYANNPLNILALAGTFSTIDGVFYAEPNGFIGDGNDLKATIYDDYVELKYSLGYGDCPAGCGSRHYWEFRINYDGKVDYLKSYGDHLP